MKGKLTLINSTAEDLVLSKDVAESTAKTTFFELQSELEQRKQETLEEIEKTYMIKQEVLDGQRQQLVSSIDNLSLTANLIDSSLTESRISVEGVHNSSHDSGVSCDEPAVNENSDDFSSIPALDRAVKTYLLYRHVISRIPSDEVKETNGKQACNPVFSESQEPPNYKHEFVAKNSYEPKENSSLTWIPSKKLTKLMEDIGSTQLGNVITNHAVASKSSLSGNCLRSEEPCIAGREECVVLTLKNCHGNLDTSVSAPVNAELILMSTSDLNEIQFSKTTSESTDEVQLHEVKCKVCL